MDHNLILNVIEECQGLLDSDSDNGVVVVRLESLQLMLETIADSPTWKDVVVSKLQLAIALLVHPNCQNESYSVGRPSLHVPIDGIEYLLSLRFNVPDIAKFYGVSRDTIFRRMSAHGLSVEFFYNTKTTIICK
jgi:hypothetical protein